MNSNGDLANNVYAQEGGLVGVATSGLITNAYAMTQVGTPGGNGWEGGLIGQDNGATLTAVYATGYMPGQGGNVARTGSAGSDTAVYFDYQMTGQGTSDSIVATAAPFNFQMVQRALPAGFSTTAWGTGAGYYPYLKTFFPNGPAALSGVGGTVDVRVNGLTTVVRAGANGFYYDALPAGNAGALALVYNANSARLQALGNGATPGFDLVANTLIAPTTATTLSQASAT